MKRTILGILLFAAPAFAQHSVSVAFFRPQYSSASVADSTDRLPIEFSGRTGFGLGYTYQRASWSYTIDTRSVSAPLAGSIDNDRLKLGKLAMFSFGALVDYHRGPFYLGGGIAQVITGDFHSEELDQAGVSKVRAGGDITYIIDGGFDLPIRGPLQLSIEGRYMPVKTSLRATSDYENGTYSGGDVASLKFNVLTAGVALRWKF